MSFTNNHWYTIYRANVYDFFYTQKNRVKNIIFVREKGQDLIPIGNGTLSTRFLT